jgi:hypothetical protein
MTATPPEPVVAAASSGPTNGGDSSSIRQQTHLAKQDLATLDTSILTALTPEVVSFC